MGIAQRYNKILRREILHFAAWSPVTDPYEVGDYGGFRQGVFQKLGHIREFGVDPEVDAGHQAPFDFVSAGVTTVRMEGDAEVKAYSGLDVEAKLAIRFSGKNSIYLKSALVNVATMRSVAAVAAKLRRAKSADGRTWNSGWRVIRKVYTAVDPSILVSTERDTAFTLSGKARALKQLEVGKASLDIAVEVSNANVVKVIGGTGPIALDLFKAGFFGASLESLHRTKEDERDPDDLDDDIVDSSEGWRSDEDDRELFVEAAK